jgi:phosphoribosylformimino-5-aminoimidazole carboxamide ribotide isomerase
VEEICSSVIIPVEFAGGIRNLDDAKQIMDTGISRLVISTMALENPEEFKKVFEMFGPKKIVTSLDIVGEEMITRGRKRKTGISYKEFVKNMVDIGIERFIVTDVERNGMLQGPNIELTKEIALLSKRHI